MIQIAIMANGIVNRLSRNRLIKASKSASLQDDIQMFLILGYYSLGIIKHDLLWGWIALSFRDALKLRFCNDCGVFRVRVVKQEELC